MREIRSHVHDPAHSLGVLLSGDQTCAHHSERGRTTQDVLHIWLGSIEVNVIYMRWRYMVSSVLENTPIHQFQTEKIGIYQSIPRMNMPIVTNSTGACPGVLLDAMIEQ